MPELNSFWVGNNHSPGGGDLLAVFAINYSCFHLLFGCRYPTLLACRDDTNNCLAACSELPLDP